MTLARQLLSLVFLLLVLVFLGTLSVHVHSSRQYLQGQLATTAQDAASTLGLTISRALAEADAATLVAVTDALFDRGLYGQLSVETEDGSILVQRARPLHTPGVPDWFVQHLSLTIPMGEARVTSGARLAGRVRVASDPGIAYTQLWRSVSEMLRWFLATSLAVSLIGVMLLRRLLRPLKQVRDQAEAICRRSFPVIKPLPRTPDLKRIVEAMNRMTGKVELMLGESEQLAAGLRRQALEHPVTGLANRRHFMDTLSALIASSEEFSQGVLVLIQLNQFKEYNDRQGYLAGDALLRATAALLQDVADDIPRHLLAHLSGADFVLLAQDYSARQGDELCRRLAAALPALAYPGGDPECDLVQIGAACFCGEGTASELLSRADTSLQMARAEGANAWRLSRSVRAHQFPVKAASAWRAFIKHSLAMNGLVFHLQPVVEASGAVRHEEVLVRLPWRRDDGGEALIPAALFIPQAEHTGLSAEVDRTLVSRVLSLLNRHPGNRYAVNISPFSLRTPGFLGWLDDRLRANGAVAGNLFFELPEQGAVTMTREVHRLGDLLERHGAHLALDHFGRGLRSIDHLRWFHISYLKLDGGFMRSLEANPDKRFFVQALTEVAHGLEIQVIAESVESKHQWALLPSLNIDGAQGCYTGRPIAGGVGDQSALEGGASPPPHASGYV